MKEETRHVRYYLRSGKQVPPRRVYCYAIETASRYEPQNSGDVLRKKTTRTVWRAANPNEKASFNSAKECRAWVARIRQGPCSAGHSPNSWRRAQNVGQDIGLAGAHLEQAIRDAENVGFIERRADDASLIHLTAKGG